MFVIINELKSQIFAVTTRVTAQDVIIKDLRSLLNEGAAGSGKFLMSSLFKDKSVEARTEVNKILNMTAKPEEIENATSS